MTVIVGKNSGSTTWMCGDASASNDHSIEIRLEPKVWKDGHWLLGVTPSFRMAQILETALDLDGSLPCPANCSTKQLVEELVPLLHSLFRSEPCASEEGWKILIGGQGRLWDIQDDYSISRVRTSAAIGSGSDYALGALHVMENNISSYNPIIPRNQCLYACFAAAKHCISVQGPFTVRKSEKVLPYDQG
jgi:hypothetical protein